MCKQDIYISSKTVLTCIAIYFAYICTVCRSYGLKMLLEIRAYLFLQLNLLYTQFLLQISADMIFYCWTCDTLKFYWTHMLFCCWTCGMLKFYWTQVLADIPFYCWMCGTPKLHWASRFFLLDLLYTKILFL